jgi:serine protease
VVAAAGNSVGHAVSTPANCPGAIAVGGLRHVGTKVGFADLGPELAISAPAGNCVNTVGDCLFPLLTATNSGTRGPLAHTFSDGQDNVSAGTSFSTPLVAGVAALMLARRPTLTAAELRYRLQATARPFPTAGATAGTPFCAAPSGVDQLECYCTTSTCGAGMLDAAAALQGLPTAPEESFLGSLPGALARIIQYTEFPVAGEPVHFGAGSTLVAPGHITASYQWEVLDDGGIVATLTRADTLDAQVMPAGNGSFTLRLTVTDGQGRSTQATHVTQVGEEPGDAGGDGAGSDDGSGGNGGGALHEAALAALLAAVLAAGAARRRSSVQAGPGRA